MDPILQTELNTAFTSQLGSHVGEPGTLCIKTWGTLSHTFFPEAPGPPYSVFLCEANISHLPPEDMVTGVLEVDMPALTGPQ